MADIKDVDTDVSLIETESTVWKSALYVFDAIEGGVGYTEKTFENIESCLQLCQEILLKCDCQSGCPACVPPLPPGVTDEDLENLLVESNASVVCTSSLLTALIKGEIEEPNVGTIKTALQAAITMDPEEEERLMVKRKLGRAAKILQKKRERLH